MSGAPTPAAPASKASTLLTTIETDLAAGVSWLENEALDAGLFVWNVVKSAFIALEPAEGQILMSLLQGVVTGAAGGKSIENIATDALNSATAAEKAVFAKAGSGVVSVLVAGLNAKYAPPTTGKP